MNSRADGLLETEHALEALLSVALAPSGTSDLDLSDLDLSGSGLSGSGLSRSGLSDAELMAATQSVERVARLAQTLAAVHAAEIARRSGPELGATGLAASRGHVNATCLVRELARTSFGEAARRIRVGSLLIAGASAGTAGADGADGAEEVSPLTPLSPLSPIVGAVAAGELEIDAADQVIRSLSPVIGLVAPDELRDAVSVIAAESATCNTDDLGRMARSARDTLNRMGVKDREEHNRAQRSLRRGRVIDGLRRVSLLLDIESDAIFNGTIDAALSPRLGGPRFTDDTSKKRATDLLDDDRTNEQMALDVLIDVLRIGGQHDDGTLLGGSKPAVRVTVSYADLVAALDQHGRENADNDRSADSDRSADNDRRADNDRSGDSGSADGGIADSGIAWIEGYDVPVSAGTARRYLCNTGALPIVLGGSSEPLDLGVARRLFSAAQRVALATRDGGCRFGDCDRPPSWCEAHHIDPYSTGGATDLSNGILLCRKHHLALHNYGWRIDRAGPPGEFLLIPPANIDPERRPIPMRKKHQASLSKAG
jgi:hypothetical protein